MSDTMKELTPQEMKSVNGGILPILAALGSFAAHSGVRTVGGYFFTRTMSIYGVYSAAASFSDK
ncbi:MAG: lactobin A/cerein 7B family class IIb bacteriocin [Candidatus Azotimanducaceae bacterium]|jgi:lactobin A/cerein 7B family class IIb bacteriocin